MAMPCEDRIEPLPVAGASAVASKLRSVGVPKSAGADTALWARAVAATGSAVARLRARAGKRMVLSFHVLSDKGMGTGARCCNERSGRAPSSHGERRARWSENADFRERAREFRRQGVVALSFSRKIGGRVCPGQVAPALERALACGGSADERRVEHDGAAADAVAARHLVKPQDALAALHQPLDDPVDRAAVEKLFGAAGPHAGDVSGVSVRALGARRALPRGEVLDRGCADAQLYQVQCHANPPLARHIVARQTSRARDGGMSGGDAPPIAVAQLALVELAGGRARQMLVKIDAARAFDRREPGAAMRDQVLRQRLGAGLSGDKLHHRLDLLAEILVGDADHAG